MIRELAVKNFKCFESLKLELRSLNVLMGLNGMGKSTILQSLLLLRQSNQENGLSWLKLNGKYGTLGNGSDVLSEKAEDEEIGFFIKEDVGDFSASYEYVQESDLLPKHDLKYDIREMGNSVLFGDRFVYLSAYRIEPRILYRTLHCR